MEVAAGIVHSGCIILCSIQALQAVDMHFLVHIVQSHSFNRAALIPLQIQDARNHVNKAIYLLMNRDVNYQFKTGSEVLKVRRTCPSLLGQECVFVFSPFVVLNTVTYCLESLTGNGLPSCTRMYLCGVCCDLTLAVHL